ncbi:hypothetical protein HAV22_15945 [Massilia sp. TW-1]|uniref:Uncharacterized protein n=1 Tax=Telluria antibiotica TaxID=2717319 RepID=A0ABX0PCS3_9BURK|nr:hypothetical protein [Telluria antibiotica]NIA55129.1 hypothetical protein [Telluria antibiotica]
MRPDITISTVDPGRVRRGPHRMAHPNGADVVDVLYQTERTGDFHRWRQPAVMHLADNRYHEQSLDLCCAMQHHDSCLLYLPPRK